VTVREGHCDKCKVRHTGTSSTMPFHQWKSAALEAAHVSEEDAHRYVTRERIQRMFHAGEPVWMAADAIKTFVTIGKREDRAERETSYLRGKMKV
jgi:hypothetical protein